MGSDFVGNIRNPYNPQQFVQCTSGKTHGCQMCAANLVFSNSCNQCMYNINGKNFEVSLSNIVLFVKIDKNLKNIVQYNTMFCLI